MKIPAWSPEKMGKLLYLLLVFSGRGSQSAQKKPTQARGEHAKPTPAKSRNKTVFCEARTPIILPLHKLIFLALFYCGTEYLFVIVLQTYKTKMTLMRWENNLFSGGSQAKRFTVLLSVKGKCSWTKVNWECWGSQCTRPTYAQVWQQADV